MSSSDRKLDSGLRLLHYWNRKHGRTQLCSDRTLRRAWEAWKSCNHAIYTLNRYGEKYLKEHLLPMQELDWSLVSPGELWFSDGHTLNFPVINPFTGKTERPTLITWFDAATRMPVGFDIDFTENKRIIMSSFKNALMFSGYCPRYVKIDNGKAFRSQEFSGKLTKAQRELLEEEDQIERTIIQGALYQCGVERVSFGIPYNSTSKAPLERWHGTLDKGIESLMPQYSGNSVANKPARMSRNEKFLQRLESGGALSLLETKLIIDEWITEIYGQEEHSGIAGKKPYDYYLETLPHIPAEQKKSPAEFYWLMLSTEVKKLSHNGVRVRDIDYWAEDLINYVGQSVSVRYEQMDDRFVYVFRSDGAFICRAELQLKSDPLATLRPGSEIQAMEVSHRIKRQRSLLKKVKKATLAYNRETLGDDAILQKMITRGSALTHTQISSSEPQIPPSPAAIPLPQPTTPDADKIINDAYKRLGLD